MTNPDERSQERGADSTTWGHPTLQGRIREEVVKRLTDIASDGWGGDACAVDIGDAADLFLALLKPASPWRPIEGAPRDGTVIDLLCTPPGSEPYRIADAYWQGRDPPRKRGGFEDGWHAPNQDYDGESGWIGNGHNESGWMPLPALPGGA